MKDQDRHIEVISKFQKSVCSDSKCDNQNEVNSYNAFGDCCESAQNKMEEFKELNIKMNISREMFGQNNEEAQQTESYKNPRNRYFGLLLSVFSGIFTTFGATVAKFMKDYHPFSLGFYRFQGIFLPSFFFLLYLRYVRKQSVFKPLWPLTNKEKMNTLGILIIRGVIGAWALLFHFFALKYVSVGDSVVIVSCIPILVTVIAHFFLGEKCGVIGILTALIAVFGVVIIARPPVLTGDQSYDFDTLVGVCYCLLSMFTGACVMVLVRYLKGLNFALVIFGFGSVATIQMVVASLIISVFNFPQDLYNFGLVVVLGMGTLCGQVCFTLALKYEQASRVAIVRTTDPIFAFVWQFLFFGVMPDMYSYIGTLVILIGVGLTAIRKWASELPKESSIKRHISFLLN